MDQNINQLVEEMTKLFTSQLTKDEGVSLPNIGTLSFSLVDGESGSDVDATDKIQTIALSPLSEDYPLLTTVIAEQGGCTEEQALSLYNKWLDAIREGDKISIRGVGEIVGDRFEIEVSLYNRLNPNAPLSPPPAAPRRARRVVSDRSSGEKSRTPIYVALVVMALLATIFVIYITRDNSTPVAEIPLDAPQTQVEEAIESPQVVEQEQVVEQKPISDARQLSKLRSKARYAPAEQALSALQLSLADEGESKRYRVVCGVLRSRINAGRLLLDAGYRSAGDDLYTPRVYPRGEGYMVTLFEADSFGACVEFIETRASKLYDSCWVYNDARMRI